MVGDKRRSLGRSQDAALAKNGRILLCFVAAVIGFVCVVWIYRPRTEAMPTIICSDGQRYLVDARSFDTRYWVYSIKLEGALGNKGKLSASLDPTQLEQLSEAMKQANEFRKWLVNSYNACILTQAQYVQYEAALQGMDNAALNIDNALTSGAQTDEGKAHVAALIDTYVRFSQQLGEVPKKETK